MSSQNTTNLEVIKHSDGRIELRETRVFSQTAAIRSKRQLAIFNKLLTEDKNDAFDYLRSFSGSREYASRIRAVKRQTSDQSRPCPQWSREQSRPVL